MEATPAAHGLIEHLELDIVESAEGRAEVTMIVRSHLKNRNGTLHGGITCTLMDVAIGRAIAGLVGPDYKLATVNLSVNFLSSCVSDKVVAQGAVVKRGRTFVYGEGTLIAEGAVAARATGTWHLAPR